MPFLLPDSLPCTHDLLQATGQTPLLLAASHGHAEAVDVLIAAGAAVEAADIALQRAPLAAAAAAGCPQAVRALLNAGALADASDSLGDTALHVASRQGCAEIVELLVYVTKVWHLNYGILPNVAPIEILVKRVPRCWSQPNHGTPDTAPCDLTLPPSLPTLPAPLLPVCHPHFLRPCCAVGHAQQAG